MHFGDEITFPLPELFSFGPVAKLKWYCNFYITQNWSATKPALPLSQKYFNFKIWFCSAPDPKLLCNVKLRKRRSLKKVHLPPGLTLALIPPSIQFYRIWKKSKPIIGREGQDGVVQCEIEEKETLRENLKESAPSSKLLALIPPSIQFLRICRFHRIGLIEMRFKSIKKFDSSRGWWVG